MPFLRVLVDGDSNKVYRAGDKVTGRVFLVLEEQEEIDSLKIVFAGSCTTKTTRPMYSNGNIVPDSQRREHEEKIRLFNREKELVQRSSLAPQKYSWTFEFTFPESTEQRYKRLVHGANYPREPHALPPSFQLKTNVPGGASQISYFVQAKLVLSDSKEIKRCKSHLRYSPKSIIDPRAQPRTVPAVLNAQIWKPKKGREESGKEESRKAVKKVFSGVSMNSSPRILPTVHHPEQVAPGQHIPLSLTLLNTRDPLSHAERECTIDSLSVTMSTYSTTMCGNSVTQPEDVVSKHVTCIVRTNMNKSIPFGQKPP
jgi:hypothetical protein